MQNGSREKTHGPVGRERWALEVKKIVPDFRKIMAIIQ